MDPLFADPSMRTNSRVNLMGLYLFQWSDTTDADNKVTRCRW